MPTIITTWTWEEAFDKFGFGDGDGIVMTDAVVGTLQAAGYAVDAHPWGCHNIVIASIKRDGIEMIPETAKVGYDYPCDYLPADIVALLDAAFPESPIVADLQRVMTCCQEAIAGDWTPDEAGFRAMLDDLDGVLRALTSSRIAQVQS